MSIVHRTNVEDPALLGVNESVADAPSPTNGLENGLLPESAETSSHLAEGSLSETTIYKLLELGFLDRTRLVTVEQLKALHTFAVSLKYTDDQSHSPNDPEEHNNQPGEFRTGEYQSRTAFALGTPAQQIESEMEAFVEWLNSTEAIEKFASPESFAAEAFIRLVEIHPFWNGNGRTSRLLMNALLMRHDRSAINTSLIDWHNPTLTGFRDCLPNDAEFLGSLIVRASKGESTLDYSRYLNPDGTRPRNTLWADHLEDPSVAATSAEVLTFFRDLVGAAPPNLHKTRGILNTVQLNAEEAKELLNILRATITHCTHPKTHACVQHTLRALSIDFDEQRTNDAVSKLSDLHGQELLQQTEELTSELSRQHGLAGKELVARVAAKVMSEKAKSQDMAGTISDLSTMNASLPEHPMTAVWEKERRKRDALKPVASLFCDVVDAFDNRDYELTAELIERCTHKAYELGVNPPNALKLIGMKLEVLQGNYLYDTSISKGGWEEFIGEKLRQDADGTINTLFNLGFQIQQEYGDHTFKATMVAIARFLGSPAKFDAALIERRLKEPAHDGPEKKQSLGDWLSGHFVD